MHKTNQRAAWNKSFTDRNHAVISVVESVSNLHKEQSRNTRLNKNTDNHHTRTAIVSGNQN